MATEADVPESISVTKEGEDGYLTTAQFDTIVEKSSPVQLKKSEGEEDQRPEPVKCIAEGENAHVESKNGISESGNPLEPLSDPKVDRQETCATESSQGDKSNQAETEIPDRENGEKKSEEKEVLEETEKKAEQHVESNDIVNVEAAEASKRKTNLDEHVQVIPDQQDSMDEIPPEKSFAAVYEEKTPEATVSDEQITIEKRNDDNSTNESVGCENRENDEAHLDTKESAEDKLESASLSDDHEEKAGLEKKIQEKNIPDTPLPAQTEETHLQEVSNADVFESYPETRSEDIIKESPKEVKNHYETLEETPEASGTASEASKDDENAECQVESPCMKHEENTLKKGEALDTGEASVAKEEDGQGFSAVEHSKEKSTDHEGESETNLFEQIQPVTYELARPNLNSEDDGAATSTEISKTITAAEEERQDVNLKQSFEEEGKEEKEITSYDTIEDETPDEQNLPVASILMRIVTESEIAEVGESTISEPNEYVERSEEVLNVLTVKCDEGDQGESTNPAKDDKDEDTFTTKGVEDDEDYTGAVTITETSVKVTPNDEESSPQTLHKCDSGEELQHSRDAMPEETKTETSGENAEEITCTEEETTIQNTQESLDKEKKEETENTEDDNAREKVLETTGTKPETGEHAVGEIHTVEELSQDFVDKETNEETSTEYQACIEAADLSTNTEEKNLEEQAIPELSSPLVVEETAKEILKEDETDVAILKEEKKEADAECREPAEVTSTIQETKPETAEDITEANKDFDAPISEEESNKTFVQNISSLPDVSETETGNNIQEKDGLAVSKSDSVLGEVSHVTGLKEAEIENEKQVENIDTALEEKGLTTILTDETAAEIEDNDVQAEENFEPEEKLGEQIPTAANEGETFLKETEAEKEEQIKYSDIAAEEKGANILTDETPLDVEDTDVQAEKNVESIENLEEQIPIRADEGETFLKETEAESKDEIKNTDVSHEDIDGQGEEVNSEENLDKQIPTGDCETSLKEAEAEKEEQVKSTDTVPEEKGRATILTDETSLDVEDIEVKAKDYVESKENVEEQIPTAADEGEKCTYSSLEDVDVQAEENFITQKNLENPILTTSDEQETSLEEAEAEIKEQVKSIDIVPEQKDLATISTAETPLDIEDIGVQAEESFESKENVEEQTPTAADEGEKFLQEAEAENKEQIEEENLNSQKSSDREKEVTGNTNTTEDDTATEEAYETTSTEQETGQHAALEIHTVVEPPQDFTDKETNEENSAEYQACTADLSTTAEEKNLEEQAIRELSSPLVVEETTNEIPKEEETYATLLEQEEKEAHATCNEPAEESEAEIGKNVQEKDDPKVSKSESVSGELSHVTVLKEAETEIERQDESTDTALEEKGQTTNLTDETTSEVEHINVQAEENFESKENLEEQIPLAADEGETFSKEVDEENKEEKIPTPADEGEKFLKEAEAGNKEQIDEENLNSQESSDKEKKEVTESTNTIEDDTEREKVLETTGAEQETGEHAVHEIHTVVETPRDSIDKETNEENSAEYQACTEAADLSTTAEEKNLDEQAIRELSSPLVVEEATKEIPKEEETYVTLLEAEEKEEHAMCNEPTEESEAEIEKNIQEKDAPTVSNSESVSGELSHVTVLKESETEIEKQDENIDTAPEEKGQATTLTDKTASEVEDIDVQAKENFESKEILEEQILTATDEGETFSKEAEAENKEQIKISDIVPEEKGLATILTDETPLNVENIGVKTEEVFESKENPELEEQLPTTSHEGEIFLKEAEAEAENNEQIKNSDIALEDKGLTTILTDEKASDIEDVGLQAEENFNSSENLESQIPSTDDEHETSLKEAEAENTEQVKYADVVPEEKGLANIATDEASLDLEDIDVKVDESFESKENVEEQIPTASHEGGTFLNEAEAENKEHLKNTDISPEEKGLATISTAEATLNVEDIGVQAERSFESKEDFEEKIPTAADEDETFLKEAEAENKEQINYSDIAPEEKGLANILTDETSLDAEDIEVKAEESLESNENLEEQIPTAAGEGETRLREAEAETNDQVKNDIAPEEKVLATISTDETALDIDDACVQAEVNSDTKEFSDEQIPTAADEGEEKIAHGNLVLNDTPGVQILEEAEPKLEVEEESYISEDHPEKTNTIVEEGLDEPKITGRDFNKEEIVEGEVACFTQESIEEDTVNKSQENEKETKNLKEEGSCMESAKEGNGDDPSPEYIREDESQTFKDNEKDAVKSGGEILKESQAEGVDESTTCETSTIAERSEEIVNTSLVKYEEGEQGESSIPASKEEDSNEDTFSIKVAEEGDSDNGATVIETGANVNREEGLPQAVQKYEPVQGDEKLLDVMPEESKTESSSENAEVVTCTKEEIKTQNIQESSDEEKKEEETTLVTDTKENETEVEEVFEIASTEQETGEHATREIHTVEDNTQEFNDKETTEENLNEYQVSSEAADLSTDVVEKNSDEQASRELSSSLVGEDTSNESSRPEENYVLGLKEEENEVDVECKQPVEVANKAHETKFEMSEDSIEPKEDLYAPISEEETHAEESSKILVNSLQSEVSEKDGTTDLKEAEAESKEQVKDIEIDHEEKGLVTILTDGATLENVNSEEFSENQIPTVADEGKDNTELAGDKTAEEIFQVKSLEEAEPKLRVEDESRESEDHPENNSIIIEEPQLLEQVLEEPKSTDGDFSEGQTTEGNAAICTPEIIQEETAKNSQDSDKETESLKEEGSSIESVKAINTNDLSQEFIQEDESKNFDDNKQDTVKFEGEILKEPEIAGVGESTTYETNQIAETSEEILDASPVKYEEGQLGEGSSQDSAKASKEEDVTEDDDNNGAVTVTESSAEVTSKGEEDSAQASEEYEPGEEKVPVKTSDVADVKEVCDLEDKDSFAEKTTEETSLQQEGHTEISELALEKQDVDATEEEFKECSEIVPESDSRSIDVVLKDEIVTSQTLDEGTLQEQVEIPSPTLLTEEKEIEPSPHEHETTTKDKDIEEEHEKEVPADENAGDLSAVRSEEVTPLQKEESRELKASELALENLDAGDTEEQIKEIFEAISKSDSQSTDAVLKDEIVADQTHLEASYASLPKEEELKTYQDEHETTTQDKSIEEEHAKETKVPADENGRDLVAATLAEETLLQKEEPRELKVSELAPENLDAGETEEEIKESFEKVSKSDSQSAEVVPRDETTAYQTLHEGISNEQLQLPSSTLLVEEKEIKISQHEHETTTQDKNREDESTEIKEVPADENTRDLFVAATSEEETRLQKEEPREFKACELAPEKLDAGEIEEEIKETLETISESDSQSIDTVSKDDIVADQTLVGASYTSLPKEEELKTYQDEHKAGENEVLADENGGDLISARSVEETILQKEDPGELKVSELALEELNAGETEEEIKKTLETVSKPDSQSTDVVSRDEAISDQTIHEGISTEKLQISSSILHPEEKEIKASEEHVTTFSDKNIEENASNLQMQDDENTKATNTAEETSLIKEERRERSNEEIKEDEKLPEESEPDSVREESHHENKAKAEKQGEQTDETSTIETNEHQNELSEVDEKGIASEKYERQLTFEDLSIKEHDPRFIEDKTIQDGFPEEEKRVEEAAFEFGRKNQGDEINSKSSITETQMEKDSNNSPIVEPSQGVETKDTKSTNDTWVAPEIKERTQVGTHLPEEKEPTTACKEQQTEEDEEEEHENSEEVKTDEEKGENEHKNEEPGYDSPIMVEASRDADVKVVSHKKSNILSGIKHSISKVKKAIIGKSSHPKT